MRGSSFAVARVFGSYAFTGPACRARGKAFRMKVLRERGTVCGGAELRGAAGRKGWRSRCIGSLAEILELKVGIKGEIE
jgi:hypothetical protein